MPAPSTVPLHFYFDFISPFGYFASLRIDELAAQHGRTVEWHPMLLGVSVMKVMGLKPLLDTPLKGPYTRNDVGRYAREHRIAMQREAGLPPMNPLACGRAFAWAKVNCPEVAKDFAKGLLHAYWAQGIDLSEASSLANIAQLATISGATLVEAVQAPEAARLLRDEVDRSLKAGVFGSPTVIVDGEMFWGIDKFAQIQKWLETGGW